jgi:uncharacterized protein YlzI (FlbEa/FlbD family)
MRKFIRVSKYNGTGPATPIYVNVDQIKGVERSPVSGTPTTTLWGIDLSDGQPLRVGESVEHVMQLIAGKD